ncbi:MAG: 2Fe-2S iron-sulfur cluster binding domain-containing protein [Candidatus Thiodiazotropha sp.]|nr:2Fe-2S iron-sulfur cluster binding domain-containing protein [Candidatus Thiodiazotropha taylori]MBT3060002.1 2Fe-2S iron-sulfur cluster binding domain-containing protein [Candidatus Thiodiazotropha sp. (ex Lucina pensylvanica)]MBT3063041.1 2Fe-2S iron-sulfur cluster binding domain-containing protein [Candidatus Thiodiazotropha sp. (ex Lucina pensylvanica)]PUB72978.1 MAG: ferredoxin [gamma proteobacterium symbiont of Ctena orbiculata]PUB79619.1 MAG: ferredoxin [gamma proteobacterium symbiont
MATRYEIYVEDREAYFHCGGEQRLLHAMQAQGLGSIPVGCKGGGCGICRIQITRGEYETRKMSRNHVTEEDERQGIVLSCRVMPKSDLRLRLAPKPKGNTESAA